MLFAWSAELKLASFAGFVVAVRRRLL